MLIKLTVVLALLILTQGDTQWEAEQCPGAADLNSGAPPGGTCIKGPSGVDSFQIDCTNFQYTPFVFANDCSGTAGSSMSFTDGECFFAGGDTALVVLCTGGNIQGWGTTLVCTGTTLDTAQTHCETFSATSSVGFDCTDVSNPVITTYTNSACGAPGSANPTGSGTCFLTSDMNFVVQVSCSPASPTTTPPPTTTSPPTATPTPTPPETPSPTSVPTPSPTPSLTLVPTPTPTPTPTTLATPVPTPPVSKTTKSCSSNSKNKGSKTSKSKKKKNTKSNKKCSSSGKGKKGKDGKKTSPQKEKKKNIPKAISVKKGKKKPTNQPQSTPLASTVKDKKKLKKKKK